MVHYIQFDYKIFSKTEHGLRSHTFCITTKERSMSFVDSRQETAILQV